MQMKQRDKVALLGGGIAVSLFLILRFAVFPVWDSLQDARANLPIQEKKLAKYREVAQTVSFRKGEVIGIESRLKDAEAGLLAGKSGPLASAELQDTVRQIAAKDAIDFRSNEFMQIKPLNKDYATVPLSVQFQCHLDELVNLLNDLSANPKYLAVSRLSIQASGTKDKLVSVAMQISGIMRAEPVQKGRSQ